MDGVQVIFTYKAILTVTEKMLKAAQANNWEELISLEQECKLLTQALVSNSNQIQLSDEMQKKKIDIIHRILDKDAKIRTITEPWMTQLQNLLINANQKRKLDRLYSSD